MKTFILLLTLACLTLACVTVVCGLSCEQNRDYRAELALYDLDKDNKINLLEFKTLQRSRGDNVTDEEMETTFREGDTNCDGKVDFIEFIEAKRKEIPVKFRLFDKDMDMSISENEINNASTIIQQNNIPEQWLEQKLHDAVTNGDVPINLQDFKNMLMSDV